MIQKHKEIKWSKALYSLLPDLLHLNFLKIIVYQSSGDRDSDQIQQKRAKILSERGQHSIMEKAVNLYS